MEKNQKTIGVLTSGGDAPGMNAAVRAVVRTALYEGAKVFVIKEGYKGMLEGNEGLPEDEYKIKEVDWKFVSGIIHKGGTIIRTARNDEFTENEGKLKAVKNLLGHGINRLVIIGGDGSLTGAKEFYDQWNALIDQLRTSNSITKDMLKHFPDIKNQNPALGIVGLIASIDNDMCGTELTIGTDTALHRIREAVDAINSTAAAHQRTFVIKVMGNKCGYLALMSAMGTGADWVFIPESPNPAGEWVTTMCDELERGRSQGRRSTIVILAEGVKDSAGIEITADFVKEALVANFDQEVRVTILGHVQRGGTPSAIDRIMSTILGNAAALKVLSLNAGSKPIVVGMRGKEIVYNPLEQVLENTAHIAKSLGERDYAQAMDLRGCFYSEDFENLCILKRAQPEGKSVNKQFLFGILHIGAPASGMNAAVRAAVRWGINEGHKMIGIKYGIEGLIGNDFEEMDWMDVNRLASKGGAKLGTSRKIPEGDDFKEINKRLKKLKLNGLLIIGGCSGYETILEFSKYRRKYKSFRIPMICLPATITNNLPGTDFCVGADTALNNIIQALDRMKQSAFSSRRCFLTQVAGRHCGYLALMSSLATGALRTYLPEYDFSLSTLQTDLDYLVKGFRNGYRDLALIILNENAHKYFDINFLTSFFEAGSQNKFNVRKSILGYLQHGGDPSPFDRNLATRLAVSCMKRLIDYANANKKDCLYAGLGTNGDKSIIKFTGFDRFDGEMDMDKDKDKRRPKVQWWTDFKAIADKLSIKN